MAGLTNLAEVGLLDHTLGSTPWGFPGQIWGCYLTDNPTDAGTQTSEIGRREIVGGFDAASGGVTQNSGQETVSTATWPDADDITHVGLAYDGASGAYFWTAALTNPISFSTGDDLNIAAGAYILRLTPSNTYAISDNARNKWLDHILGTSNWILSGTPEVRLHTADPGSAGTAFEFTGGGYARASYTAQAPASGDPTTGTHLNAMQYLDSQSDPLDYWTIHRGTDFLYGRNQTTKPVSPGATIDIPIGRLVKQVD